MCGKAKPKHLKTIEHVAPEAMKAFQAFERAALADGEVPMKYNELAALESRILPRYVLHRYPRGQSAKRMPMIRKSPKR